MMPTIMMSPLARNRAAGLLPPAVPRKRTDWYHRRRIDRSRPVCDTRDPRHVGRVISIINSVVEIRWDETGWISEIPYDRVENTEE